MLILTFRRRDSNSHEELRVEKGKLDHFSQLSNLLAQSSDCRVGDISRVLVGHVVHQRVDLSWKVAHDSQCGHVQRHPGCKLEVWKKTRIIQNLVPGFSFDFSSCLLHPTTYLGPFVACRDFKCTRLSHKGPYDLFTLTMNFSSVSCLSTSPTI